MKSLKLVGTAAIAAVALTASIGAGTATATELDCSITPTEMCPAETAIHLEREGPIFWHVPFAEFECNNTTFQGKTTTTGNSSETVKGHWSEIFFKECGAASITVLKPGTFEIHTDTSIHDRNGTLTWTGGEITVELAPLHCVYTTNNTPIATITGSKAQGETAIAHLEGKLPRTGGRSGIFCGASAELTGTFTITTPMTLVVT